MDRVALASSEEPFSKSNRGNNINCADSPYKQRFKNSRIFLPTLMEKYKLGSSLNADRHLKCLNSSRDVRPDLFVGFDKHIEMDLSNNKFTGDLTAPVPALKLPICAKLYTVEESQLSHINLLLLAEIRFFCVHTKDLPDGQILAVKNVKTLAFSITDEEEQFLEVIRTASPSMHVPIAGHLAVHGNEYLRKVVTFDDALHNVSCMPLNWSRIAGALKNPCQDVLSGSLADLFVGFDKHVEMDLSNNKFNGDLNAALVPALKMAICAKLQLQFSPINLLVVEIRQILAVKNIKTLALSITDEAEQFMEVIRTASPSMHIPIAGHLALHGNHHLRNAVTFDDALHNVSCLLLRIAGALNMANADSGYYAPEHGSGPKADIIYSFGVRLLEMAADPNVITTSTGGPPSSSERMISQGARTEKEEEQEEKQESEEDGNAADQDDKEDEEDKGDDKEEGEDKGDDDKDEEEDKGDDDNEEEEEDVGEQPEQVEDDIDAADGQQEQPQQIEAGDGQQEQPEQVEVDIDAGDAQQIEDEINAGDAQQQTPPEIEDGINAGDAQQPPPPRRFRRCH
ncbi:hypothetical protein P3S67_029295 [Capsicum chacoense]